MNGPSLMHRVPRRLLALALLTGAALVTNVWFAARRLEGFNVRLASFTTIYEPLEEPAVVGFERTASGLEVELSSAPRGWRVDAVRGDGRRTVAEVGDDRRFLLAPDDGTYALAPADGDVRRERRFRVQRRDALFSSSDLLLGRFSRLPLAELAHARSDHPPADVAAVEQLLRAEGIDARQGDTEERLRRVWSLLYPRLDARRGRAPRGFDRLPTLEQYRRIMDGSAKGLCTQHARIFALFSAVAGIPTRVVDTNRELDGLHVSAHTFTEVYLPERERWAYVDPSLNVLRVRDRGSGLPLSAVQLAHLHEAGATSGLVATIQRDGGLVDVPYDEVRELVQTYVHPNATFVFQRLYHDRGSLLAWLDRYLLRPELAYSLYGDNRPYWAKMTACLALLALGGLTSVTGARELMRRVRRREPA